MHVYICMYIHIVVCVCLPELECRSSQNWLEGWSKTHLPIFVLSIGLYQVDLHLFGFIHAKNHGNIVGLDL